eukprot:jgi/Tetstr1/447294/TSEL_034731.t1
MFSRADSRHRKGCVRPAPENSGGKKSSTLRRKELRDEIAKWNAENPDHAMRIVSFNKFKRTPMQVACVSSLALEKCDDFLKPYVAGTGNDVIFVMRCGFVTTCKVQDLTRALTVRVRLYEAIENTKPILQRKGMHLVTEELPYPVFDTMDMDTVKMTVLTAKHYSDEDALKQNDVGVMVLKYYVKDIFSEHEFVVVRGMYRTPVVSAQLYRTILATAFLGACCICGDEGVPMRADVLTVEDFKVLESNFVQA